MEIIIVLVVVAIAFICGRKYERKQFIHVGKKRPTTQDVILGKRN